MKIILKSLSVVIVLAMLLSMCACFGKTGGELEKTVVDNVYKMVKHPLPEEFDYIGYVIKTENGYMITGDAYDEETGYKTAYASLDKDFNFIEYLDIDIDVKEGYDKWINYVVPTDAGYIVTYNTGFYDETTGYYESNNYIALLDGDMNVISAKTVDEMLAGNTEDDRSLYVSYLTALEGSKIAFSCSDSLYFADGELNIILRKPISDFNGAQYINNIVNSPRGLVVIYYDAEWNNKAVIFDANTLSASEEYDFTNVGYGMYFEGTGEYDLYYNDSEGIYGYSFEKGEGELLMSYINSDLNNFSPNSLIPQEGHSFICPVWDPDDNSRMCIVELNPVPDSEVTPKYIITLGCLYMNYKIRQQVFKFNRDNEEYRIVLKDYSQDIDYSDGSEYTYEDAIAKLNSDIASGDVPDLFICASELPFDSYVSKGLFVDLYEFMDADETINRGDYEANVLKAFETDGKLYRISPNYAIQGYVGLESVIGEYAENWNTDAFLELANSLPENTSMFAGDITRGSMLEILMTAMYGEFINVNTGKCTFNDGKFAKLLEYCGTLRDKSIYETVDWDNVDDSFWQDMNDAPAEGRVALTNYYFSSFSDLTSLMNYNLKTDKITLVGYPTESGNPIIADSGSSIAVSSRSQVKDGAWQFVKSLLSKEYQDNLEWEFPVLTSSLIKLMEKQIEDDQEAKKREEENGGTVDGDFGVVMPAPRKAFAADIAIAEEERTQRYYLNEEYANTLLEYIRRADTVSQSNREVMKMINEESTRYFEGKCSASDAAQAIQSGVSLYISESR